MVAYVYTYVKARGGCMALAEGGWGRGGAQKINDYDNKKSRSANSMNNPIIAWVYREQHLSEHFVMDL